jgi:hypothetical protein
LLRRDTSECSRASALYQFKDTVLFLDEVQSGRYPKDTEDKDAKRLRFLRNFGRALGMRVVMAGTAATHANMIEAVIPVRVPYYGSYTSGPKNTGWMEIYFLCSPVRPFVSANQEQLPWLAARKTSNRMKSSFLKALAGDIASRKQFSNENKLIWLSGSWLDSTSESPVSPFKLRSAELVRGHFCEPAIAVHTRSMRPYLGTGHMRVNRVKGS